MAFTVCEAPASSALALNVPEGGLHGYDEQALKTGLKWATMRARARQNVDMARHAVAHAVCREIGQVLWLVNTGEEVLERSAEELSYIEKNGERDRRRLLGTLAIAELAEGILTDEDFLVDGRGLKETNCMMDIMAKDGMPLPPRIHTEAGGIERLLGSAEGAPGTWYVNESGLYVQRTALDISAEMQMMLAVDNIQVADVPMETLFPYLPARAAA
jgi:hypothetical protein